MLGWLTVFGTFLVEAYIWKRCLFSAKISYNNIQLVYIPLLKV